MKRFGRNNSWFGYLLIMGLIFSPFPLPAHAQITPADFNEPIEFTATDPGTPTITLYTSSSRLVTFSRPVVRTAIGDTEIIDIVALSPLEIMIVANGVGSTNLVTWYPGNTTRVFHIMVQNDPRPLQALIDAAEPTGHVEVKPLKDTFALFGDVGSVAERARLMAIADGYQAGVVDLLVIKEPKQILIEVYFVELDRTASDDYGQSYSVFQKNLILNSLAGNVSGQGFGGQTFTPTNSEISGTSIGNNTGAQFSNFFADGQHFIGQNVEWLETNNYLRLIAQPKLLARDGEEAEFLVGGEFPYAVSSEGSANVAFRSFGTELVFTPLVLENDRLRLTIRTKVSELNFSTTVTVAGSTVPSLTENSARTVVELRNHEILVIGGFMNIRTNKVETKVPFLGDLPGIGRFFKSKDNEERKHELMFIIAPHIVEPIRLNDEEKTEEYFDPEQVKRVLYIEALPDADFQGDALRSAIQHFNTGHLKSQDDEVIESTFSEPIVIERKDEEKSVEAFKKEAESDSSQVASVSKTADAAVTEDDEQSDGASIFEEVFQDRMEKMQKTQDDVASNPQPEESKTFSVLPKTMEHALDAEFPIMDIPMTPVVTGAAMTTVASPHVEMEAVVQPASFAPTVTPPLVEIDKGVEVLGETKSGFISRNVIARSEATPLERAPVGRLDQRHRTVGMAKQSPNTSAPQGLPRSFLPKAEVKNGAEIASALTGLAMTHETASSLLSNSGVDEIKAEDKATKTVDVDYGAAIDQAVAQAELPDNRQRQEHVVASYDREDYGEALRQAQMRSVVPEYLDQHRTVVRDQDYGASIDRAAEEAQPPMRGAEHRIPVPGWDSAIYQDVIRRAVDESMLAHFVVEHRSLIEEAPTLWLEEERVFDPQTVPGSGRAHFQNGYRNFRLSETSWSPQERQNYRREQERLDRFFAEAYKK